MAAYALETGGHAEVTAVLRSNYQTVLERGFSIDSIEHGQGIIGFRPTQILNKVPDVSKGDSQPFDYIVVTTKNIPDVPPTVADIIQSAVTDGQTTIVLLQNGLNIERPIIKKFPTNIVLSGVSIISASEPSYGHIIHEFPDELKVGPFNNPNISPVDSEASAKRFVDIYNACGKVNCQYDPNVPFTRWRKLVYNASFNSVSALLGLGVISMRKSCYIIDELVRPIMREIIATAAAAGISLSADIDEVSIKIDPIEDDFLPSMGQDAAKGNFIEVEVIVGEAVREAERLRVDVPTLSTVYSLLKGLQMKTKVKRGVMKLEFGEGNPYR